MNQQTNLLQRFIGSPPMNLNDRNVYKENKHITYRTIEILLSIETPTQ